MRILILTLFAISAYGQISCFPSCGGGGGGGGISSVFGNTGPAVNSIVVPNSESITSSGTGQVVATSVVDPNKLPAIKTAAGAASAVDYLQVTDAATGNPATVQASAAGSDANVNLLLQGKGSGQVQVPLQATFLSSGSAGNYTLNNSAILIKKSDGTELLRAWCTDPDFIDDSFNVSNCYFGYQAGFSQPTDNTSAGSLNSGFGAYALYSITTGFDNTALGFGALFGVTSGSDNTGIGYETMYNSTSATGNQNTAIGSYAIESNQSGSGNVAIGYAAMYNNATGSNNLALGFEACINQTTLSGSMCLGNSTSLTDGITNAAAIGNSASAGVSNEIVLGGTAVTQTVLPDGDLYIASPSRGLILTDTVTSTCYRIQMTSGVLAWTALGSCPAF